MCSQSHFSLVKITPAHLELLNQLLPPKEAAGQTRALIIGGEALSGKSLSFWRTYAPETRMINEYGPTETVVGCCVYEVPDQTPLSGSVPIGRPIANTQIYLLNQYLQPVPVGVTGELYIGGDGLARGYLNRPELTAEKFIPNPFSNEPGARLYKTGDLARYLPDGNIEFLGRIDYQIKIRGFRIELGEIEAVLTQHPSVRETVVLAREDSPGDKRLVAYIVPAPGQNPTSSELRRFLKEKLPEYMVPSAFVMLEKMPLTPNGKVDRQALPAPETSRSGLETAYIAPSTPTEEVLARIWAQVLGLEQIGISDNFFELGGHSLQAMQLISKISVAMNKKISVRLLFLHPTIAELANALEALQRRESPKPVPSRLISASFEEFPTPQSSPFFQLEGRSLLSLFAAGKVAPVDAAALGYLPDSILEHTGLSRDEVKNDWCENLPVWYSILETHWGRIAVLLLPRFRSELYSNKADLVDVIVEALEMAGRVGARTVSLTGLIPSATDYGAAIAKAIAGRKDCYKSA